MKAYKLLKQRADGSLGSLFINRKQKLPVEEWMKAGSHPTKGYAFRPGWHCTSKPEAPHLKKEGRVWAEVSIDDYERVERPENQGGLWYLSNWMRIDKIIER